MKRIIPLILAVIMLLSAASCGMADTVPPTDAVSDVIVSSDLESVASKEDATARVLAKEDTYIRSGSYSKNNYYNAKKEGGTMEFKMDSSNFRRDVLLKFDLTNLKLFGMQTVFIYVNLTSVGGSTVNGNDLYIHAYEIPCTWDSKTVTYETAPAVDGADPAGSGYLANTGVCQIDVSDAVFDAVDSGRTEIAFRLVMSEQTNSQAYMTSMNNDNTNVRPKLVARSTSSEYNYETKMVADEAENQALWDYAQEMYDEWYVRYQEILNKGDYAYETVVTNASEYNTQVTARKGNGGKDVNSYATRLVSDLAGYDEYVYGVDDFGGAMPSEKQEAKGYYYTAQINGRWWLVDPLGNLCHIHGTTHFKYGYGTSENHYSTYQTNTALAVFGSLEKWAIAATRWAKNDLAFNATYSVAAVSRKVENPIPNIYGVGGMSSYANSIGALIPNGGGIPAFVGGAMPVFDPGFVDFMDGKAKTAAENTRNNPYIIGYITDNEIVVSDRMLASYLTLDHTVDVSVYSYVCAWTWFKNMTGEENPSVHKIAEYSDKLGVDLYDVFKGFIYDRYYAVCKGAIEKYEPNRLYFGNRFLIDCKKWEWMTRVTGYWCDVMCINYYHVWEIPTTREEALGYPTLDQFGAWLGKPFLVTEFYSKGDDAVDVNGNPFTNNDGAGWVVASQTERGYFYQNYTLKLLQCKHSIGWMQFQFIDNDPTTENGESSNKGIVDSNNNFAAYSDFTDQLAMLNKNTYALIEYFDNYDYFK